MRRGKMKEIQSANGIATETITAITMLYKKKKKAIVHSRIDDTIYQPFRSGRIWHKVNF